MQTALLSSKSMLCKLWAAAAALLLTANAWAQSPTPTTLTGGKVISVQDAHKLAAAKTAAFFDTRNVINFGKGHVPGAQAMPYKGSSEDKPDFDASKDPFDASKLPAAKDKALVFYSDGPTGWKSYKAAVQAVKAGYKNVHYMREGWSAWTAAGLPAEN